MLHVAAAAAAADTTLVAAAAAVVEGAASYNGEITVTTAVNLGRGRYCCCC